LKRYKLIEYFFNKCSLDKPGKLASGFRGWSLSETVGIRIAGAQQQDYIVDRDQHKPATLVDIVHTLDALDVDENQQDQIDGVSQTQCGAIQHPSQNCHSKKIDQSADQPAPPEGPESNSAHG